VKLPNRLVGLAVIVDNCLESEESLLFAVCGVVIVEVIKMLEAPIRGSGVTEGLIC
jgi:hypothetical protein